MGSRYVDLTAQIEDHRPAKVTIRAWLAANHGPKPLDRRPILRIDVEAVQVAFPCADRLFYEATGGDVIHIRRSAFPPVPPTRHENAENPADVSGRADRDRPQHSGRACAPTVLLLIVAFGCGPRPFRATPPRFVAHAMGGIAGHVYTNSLEAWQRSYANGYRLFEVDLRMTSDRKLVAFHDGNEKAWGLPIDFTHADFMSRKILGMYTPLDADSIAQLLEQKQDWRIVSDTKGDLRSSLALLCGALNRRKIACSDRVIPQIYHPETDLRISRELGFSQVIFTIYLTRLEADDIVRIARSDPRIVAVTVPWPRATETLVAPLSRSGIRCYVHTVNGRAAIERQFARGVWGVYTDSGLGEDFSVAPRQAPSAGAIR